ncbi:hypothetical protein WJX72_012219 [[Myrmecia] bisecta]|uniref:PIH1 N-terminal domain-containing protein n=1 Tax=[Myrmecia] bisecta TaxID=41462 RepID=A0AAW1PLE9_9CHLO
MDGLMEQLSRMATNPSTPSSDSSGGGLKALLRGLDPDALKDFDPRQVEHLWKHMDELASRPEEYRAFVRSQAAHAGFDPSKLPPSVRAAADKQGSKGPQAQAKGGKAPAPIMAYLRMTGAPGGDDLLASPDACIALKRASGAAAAALAPRYANGRPFAEADTDLRGLQVPLGMRRPPRMQASSHAGNLGKEETMFDVECHPTAVAAAMAQPEGFRRYLIQAAVQFLQRKFGIKLGEATRILVATQELLAGELQ